MSDPTTTPAVGVLRAGLLPEPLIFERGAAGRTGLTCDPGEVGGPPSTDVLPVTWAILDEAVHLRQIRRMSLGDALVAATALVHGLPLATRNTGDFDWIDGLTINNPLAGS